VYEIWRIEGNGDRELIRNDVRDAELARGLVTCGNEGAVIRGQDYRYVAVPDPFVEQSS